jgi:hypothetical protein
MENEKLLESSRISENTYVRPITETVKLVEMGDVSVETKGYVAGLEISMTPRN